MSRLMDYYAKKIKNSKWPIVEQPIFHVIVLLLVMMLIAWLFANIINVNNDNLPNNESLDASFGDSVDAQRLQEPVQEEGEFDPFADNNGYSESEAEGRATVEQYPDAPNVIEYINGASWYLEEAKTTPYQIASQIPFDSLSPRQGQAFTNCQQDPNNYFCSTAFFNQIATSDDRLFLDKNNQIVLTRYQDSADQYHLSLIHGDIIYPSSMLLKPLRLLPPYHDTLPVRYRYVQFGQACIWGELFIQGQQQKSHYRCFDFNPLVGVITNIEPLIVTSSSVSDYATDYGAVPLDRTNYYMFIIPKTTAN